ncbi:hypothetical protein CVE24_06060, partial [Pseudomonas syringae pv. actinidiae]|nr:hypothetical protein [Pseudomonas syringae pv. actinidiae]
YRDKVAAPGLTRSSYLRPDGTFCPQGVGATGAAIRIVREDCFRRPGFCDCTSHFASKLAPTTSSGLVYNAEGVL